MHELQKLQAENAALKKQLLDSDRIIFGFVELVEASVDVIRNAVLRLHEIVPDETGEAVRFVERWGALKANIGQGRAEAALQNAPTTPTAN